MVFCVVVVVAVVVSLVSVRMPGDRNRRRTGSQRLCPSLHV